MPDIDDAAIALREKAGWGVRRIGAMWSAAIIVAIPLILPACAPVAQAPPPAAADTGSPTIAEAPSGPIALAPAITGTPLPPPAPEPGVALAEPAPAPVPAVAPVAALALSAPAVDSAPAAPSPCPPGLIAVMSKPDMSGTPVLLCRRSPLPR